MNKSYWLIAFVFALVCELISIQWQLSYLHYAVKPLLVPLVVGYLLSSTSGTTGPLKKWILCALFFSWLGDMLLMFDERAEIYFLSGLSSFLIAHIFYIVFFHKIRVSEKLRSNFFFV